MTIRRDDWKSDRVGSALEWRNPTVLAEIDASRPDAVLHAHVRPRYDWEPPEIVGRPVWLYPVQRWSDPADGLGPSHDPRREALGHEIDRLRRVGGS